MLVEYRLIRDKEPSAIGRIEVGFAVALFIREGRVIVAKTHSYGHAARSFPFVLEIGGKDRVVLLAMREAVFLAEVAGLGDESALSESKQQICNRIAGGSAVKSEAAGTATPCIVNRETLVAEPHAESVLPLADGEVVGNVVRGLVVEAGHIIGAADRIQAIGSELDIRECRSGLPFFDAFQAKRVDGMARRVPDGVGFSLQVTEARLIDDSGREGVCVRELEAVVGLHLVGKTFRSGR